MLRKLFFPLLISLVVIRVIYTFTNNSEGQELLVTFLVSREPYVGESYQLIDYRGLSIFLPKNPEITYGDKLTLSGKVSSRVLQDVKVLERTEGGLILSSERKKIVDFIKRTLPEPHSSLVSGVTIGSKSGMPNDFMEKIRKTGVAHVVVASGMNVTLVVATTMGILLYFMPRRKAIVAVYAFTFGYVALSGFDPPIVRAAIMASVVYLGQLFGRVVSTLRVLFLTVLIMIIIFPYWISDVGFILSFVATLSLVLFERKVRSKLKLVPPLFRESLSTTLAAQIGVTPILYVTFGSIYILSPVVNMLVLWTIPYITVLGMLASVLLYIVPVAAKGAL